MSKRLFESRVVQREDTYTVYDDGIKKHLYGVYIRLTDGTHSLIGSGMKKKNAIAVAKAMREKYPGGPVATKALLLE